MVFQQSRSAIESIVKEFVNQIQELSNIIDLSINSARIDIKTLINIPELNSILSREEELLRFLETIRVTVSDLTEALAQNEGRPATPAISVTNFEKAFKQYEALLRVDLPNIPTVLNTFGKDREEQIKIVENSLLARSEGLSTSEQAVIMESDIRNLQATVTRLRDRSSSLSKELEGVNRVIEIHNSIKSEAGELSRLLEVKVNAILASTFETIREPIVNILSDYLDGESIELHIDIESTENPDDPDLANRIITAKVSSVDKDTGEVILVSPNKYFNTFRYRLFCMMVTLGIAITARKDSKINLPLVLDDIFYASDYGSKTSFKKFLIKVFSIFKKFNSDMPLQFILFTHDELILDGALEAMSEYSDEMVTANEPIPATDDVAEEWKAPISERTIVARLFPAEEADHSPRTCTLGTFWDLIYKIPHPIQVQLLNEI
jgi:hypothetical protein